MFAHVFITSTNFWTWSNCLDWSPVHDSNSLWATTPLIFYVVITSTVTTRPVFFGIISWGSFVSSSSISSNFFFLDDSSSLVSEPFKEDSRCFLLYVFLNCCGVHVIGYFLDYLGTFPWICKMLRTSFQLSWFSNISNFSLCWC